MPRYTKQRDTYGCGPVAVINALKWAGKDISLNKETKKHYYRMFWCSPDAWRWDEWYAGTHIQDMTWNIFRINEYIKCSLGFHGHVKIKDIDEQLNENKVVIVRYVHRKRSKTSGRLGHYFLVVGKSKSGKSFYVVNFYNKGKALRRISRKKFKKIVFKYREYTCMWPISKRTS